MIVAPGPARTAEIANALPLWLAISAESGGVTRVELARRFAHQSSWEARLSFLVRSGRVLACWRHRGSRYGPPELVYHALSTRGRS